ncbi:MAG: hypothetical protein Roseis2KO_03470 [Roseivirga sp.]
MSNFAGTWKDLADAIIDIKAKGRQLTIQYPPGRGAGPFQGHEIDLYHPVIDVNFYDKIPETGVLSNDRTTIYWGNGSKWVRQ